MTLSQFRDKADSYRKRQVGKTKPLTPLEEGNKDGNQQPRNQEEQETVEDELARKFWKRLGPIMEAPVYGADVPGSLFKPTEHACGWNIDRLDSSLRLLSSCSSIPGVTEAYIYVGMWGSMFCAHAEDMNLLSINYLHAGSPKYWYSIPAEHTARFRSLAVSRFPTQSSSCNEFLRHKRSLISPGVLRRHGIPYRTCVQYPGDAIITFPGCYHFGFNTGFNVAESSNFGVPEWLNLGLNAGVCMCHPHSVRLDMKKLWKLVGLYEAYKERHKQQSKDNQARSIMLSHSEWVKQYLLKCAQKDDHQAKHTKHYEGVNGNSIKTHGINVFVFTSPDDYMEQADHTEEDGEWRLALRVQPHVLIPQTQILLRRHDLGDKTCWLSAVITELVENHVRVHSPRTSKRDDVWMKNADPQLFLDAGPGTASLDDDKAVKRKCNSSKISSQLKNKKQRLLKANNNSLTKKIRATTNLKKKKIKTITNSIKVPSTPNNKSSSKRQVTPSLTTRKKGTDRLVKQKITSQVRHAPKKKS